MKIAVFSDSHSECSEMLRAVLAYAPDLLIHLGDYCSDAAVLASRFPDIPLRAVRGNCDMAAPYPDKQVFQAAGAKLLITHGHLYRVRFELEPILNAAHFEGCSVALFGHTHEALCRQYGGITLINPGSCGRPPSPSWAALEIGDDGGVACKLIPIKKQ